MSRADLLKPVPANADGPTALVGMGHAVIRIENETMAQIAVQRPRDEAKVLAAALKELEMVPEEASRAYYEIPYRDTAPGGEQKMVKVSGPSIRAATTLARRWGNCSATARIVSEDEEAVDVEGIFLDYESSVRFTRPQRVSKWMRTRRGMVQLDGKRLEAAIGAGGSKAMRNAILTGLPTYLVSAYDKRAREIVGGKAEERLGPQKVAAMVKAFAEFKLGGAPIDQARLEAYLDKKAEDWTGTDRASLVGVYNAMKDGQTTPEEVFGAGNGDEASAPSVVTPESLFTGATVTGENMASPADAEPDDKARVLEAIATEKARDAVIEAVPSEPRSRVDTATGEVIDAQPAAERTPAPAEEAEAIVVNERDECEILLGRIKGVADKLRWKADRRAAAWDRFCRGKDPHTASLDQLNELYSFMVAEERKAQS